LVWQLAQEARRAKGLPTSAPDNTKEEQAEVEEAEAEAKEAEAEAEAGAEVEEVCNVDASWRAMPAQ
jgi:hypothetical protein